MKKITKHLASLGLIACMLAPAMAVKAFSLDEAYGGATNRSTIETSLGLQSTKDPRVIVGDIIKLLLGFLGIIATIIILLAGFKWMTAGGNQANVDAAKKLMTNGVIGLIIVLSAWALSVFIIGNILNVTGTGTGE